MSKDNPIDSDVDRAKQELKKRYKPEDYEALIEFAAKYFISDSRRRIEMDNFHQAMLGMEFAKADQNKEAQELLKENFKNNSLLEAVIRFMFYSGKFISWKANAAAHSSDKEAKNLVLKWWLDDKKTGCNKADKITGYRTRLGELGLCPKCNTKSKTEKLEDDEKKNYTCEIISRWLSNK